MLFQSADAIRISGLTQHQLREWCGRGRRGILAADMMPGGPGRHALYAWPTLLTLRLLLKLHGEFGIEVGKLADVASLLRAKVGATPFTSLWAMSALFPSCTAVELTATPEQIVSQGGIVLPLEPHLVVLASAMALPVDEQLPLLPPMSISR